MTMQCPFSEWHCLICGTCTSPPGEAALAHWQFTGRATEFPGFSDQDNLLDNDHVSWLGRTHIIGGPNQRVLPPEGQQPALDQNTPVMLTGITRYRHGQVQFVRGNASDADFENKTKSVRSHGPKEVLSISYHDLLELRRRTPSVYLSIHGSCFDILSRVRKYKYSIITHIDQEPVDFRSISNQIFNRLRSTWQYLPKQDWTNKGVCQSASIVPSQVLDTSELASVPKDYLFDPCASLYLQRISWRYIFNEKNEQVSEPFSNDRLTLLPTEILLSIAELLTTPEIRCLTQASLSARYKISFSYGFWSARIKADMPWLWEVDGNDQTSTWKTRVQKKNGEKPYDWQALHFFLAMIGSQDSPRRSPSLANRKRIWALCEALVEADDA